jgi:hypothetical protein
MLTTILHGTCYLQFSGSSHSLSIKLISLFKSVLHPTISIQTHHKKVMLVLEQDSDLHT